MHDAGEFGISKGRKKYVLIQLSSWKLYFYCTFPTKSSRSFSLPINPFPLSLSDIVALFRGSGVEMIKKYIYISGQNLLSTHCTALTEFQIVYKFLKRRPILHPVASLLQTQSRNILSLPYRCFNGKFSDEIRPFFLPVYLHLERVLLLPRNWISIISPISKM